jgi:hypothetical protein
MKISTAVNHQRRFIQRVRDVYSHANICMWSHEELIKHTLEIKTSPEFKRCPRHVTEYVRGYEMALYDQLWNKMVSCFISLESGTIYFGKYPESPSKITFLGHAWPGLKSPDLKFYTKRPDDEITQERLDRGKFK